MIIAIMILVLINTAAVAYLAMTIFDMHDHVSKGFNSQLEIMKLQNELLRNDLDALNRWSDLSADIISHIERVEDMEGDIKDIFEWIHSVDNNVADMRRDIQDTETKLGDLMAVHDRNVLKFFNDLQSLQKDITEIKTSIDTNACWKIRSAIENGDTDGDIPTNVIRGHSNYRQFLSSSDNVIKNMNTTPEGEDKDDNNRAE